MGPEGIILVNPPITTVQQSLTHSALRMINNDTNNIHPKSLQGKCTYLGNKLFAKSIEFCKFYLVNIFNH